MAERTASWQKRSSNADGPILSPVWISSIMMQTTLKHSIHCRGIGLHGGQPVLLRLVPAEADTGIRFQRLDRV